MRTYLLLALLLAFIVGTTLAVPASDVTLVSDNPLADLMKPPCREESKTCGWLIAAKCVLRLADNRSIYEKHSSASIFQSGLLPCCLVGGNFFRWSWTSSTAHACNDRP
ncbi:hypothetical protein M432DRAFT_610412, partial [Thermoascus aurantiacus ATCC 26904]